ncbi:aspartate carbamoyltransferase [Gorillibacterium timonense]|uniref:aspartate carbamoyltransferase n=1 Tax=Gorillibacterium timonense TaxID=1689269 RepID=UPI00071C8D76|nr:aspartate carbamoyltransferase [Gorillibacterium timonense]
MTAHYHILGAKQFNRTELEELFDSAARMEDRETWNTDPRFAGKIMTTLFFESSTRTRLSFESAMSRLGGKVIGTENAAQFSSTIKGETLEDTIRIVSGYSDIIVLRHTDIGAAERAAKVADVPIINAGDGAGEHPTQALLDLYSIRKECGRIDGLTIAMIGDLTYGRTVHSLSYMLANFQNIKLLFVSPENVGIPSYVKHYLEEQGVAYSETENFEDALQSAEVLYQTRIQKERFPSIEEYRKAEGRYIINRDILSRMRKDSIILHPLPRAGEIAPEVDEDPRAAYFRQAQNGLYIRMALVEKCLTF